MVEHADRATGPLLEGPAAVLAHLASAGPRRWLVRPTVKSAQSLPGRPTTRSNLPCVSSAVLAEQLEHEQADIILMPGRDQPFDQGSTDVLGGVVGQTVGS